METCEMGEDSLFATFYMVKQGAEGRLFEGVYLGKQVVVKERFVKKYRHPALDEMLTKERMKAEARALLRCKVAEVYTPAVYLVDFERRCIIMEQILNSVTAKDYLNNLLSSDPCPSIQQAFETMAREIGNSVGRMHTDHIIHGDLTTSNMLVARYNDKIDKLYFIDFGLSHMSQTAEDKAVDLYVLEKALLSTHANSELFFSEVLKYYKATYKSGSKEVMSKLEEVRSRGRKRTMVG